MPWSCQKARSLNAVIVVQLLVCFLKCFLNWSGSQSRVYSRPIDLIQWWCLLCSSTVSTDSSNSLPVRTDIINDSISLMKCQWMFFLPLTHGGVVDQECCIAVLRCSDTSQIWSAIVCFFHGLWHDMNQSWQTCPVKESCVLTGILEMNYESNSI